MKRDIKRLVIRSSFFIFPLLLLLFLELFVFPLDQFTLRAWETLKVKSNAFTPFVGPFYQNKYLEIEEIGELASYTPYAKKRKVVWYTDKYGFRNRNTDKKPEIVLIGDSQITGIKLSQEEIMSEVLSRKLNTYVYSFAPGTLEEFLYTRRFMENPPRYVIIERTERLIHVNDSLTEANPEFRKNALLSKIRSYTGPLLASAPVVEGMVLADRIQKFTMYRKAKKMVELKFATPEHHFYGGEFFIQGEAANLNVPEAEIDRQVKVLKQYQQVLQERGIKMIFLPVPNKENIYHQLLPSDKRPTYLLKLRDRLHQENIPMIDTQTAFEQEYQKSHTKLYPVDDGHWNARAVEIAADLLAETIDSLEHTAVKAAR